MVEVVLSGLVLHIHVVLWVSNGTHVMENKLIMLIRVEMNTVREVVAAITLTNIEMY